MDESQPVNPEIQPIIELPEIPIKSFKTLIERNKEITERFANGIPVKAISMDYGISEPQVYSVVRNHPGIMTTNRELEKVRRLRRLKLCENKAPKNLAPKTATELVQVIKAQKDELEGDSSQVSTNNTQVNINIEVSGKSQDELWAIARSLLGQ